jgi:hypothetical protein
MNTATRWVCSLAGAVALACGGQVDTASEAPVGGSAGTSAATGGNGTGGSAGSAGRAGSDGSGGVAGSSGGVAGNSGGVAGSSGGVAGGSGGAMTGGAAGAGGGPIDILAKVRQVCAAMQASGCGPTDCLGTVSNFVEQIISHGCAPQFVAVLDCMLTRRAVCVDLGGCSPAMEAMAQCMAPNSCIEYSSTSDGGCGAECGDWAVDCKPGPPGRMNCLCNFGPRAGAAFVINEVCSSPNWLLSVRTFCTSVP